MRNAGINHEDRIPEGEKGSILQMEVAFDKTLKENAQGSILKEFLSFQK
jgi:hypothetical protein